MVVDDDPFNILSFKALLSSNQFGYECLSALGGYESMEVLKSNFKQRKHCEYCPGYVKFIFMDVNMPEIDGLETTKEIIKL